MSAIVQRSPAARLDLLNHFIYIGEGNLDAARRFLTAAQADCRSLARMPGMGALRDFKNQKYAGMRSWPIKGFENYLIFYLPAPAGIYVVRVVHGAQDLLQARTFKAVRSFSRREHRDRTENRQPFSGRSSIHLYKEWEAKALQTFRSRMQSDCGQ